jgi:hypothetical protein
MTKFVKKWGRSAALVLTVACLALGIGIAPAQAQPPGIPHNFYGYAYINGALATVGKTVVAKINDVQVGSTTVTTATGYNYQIQVSSATGGTVVFWVDGVQATPTATYNAGFYTQLNLYTYTTTLGVTTGSASSITSNSATLGGTLTGLGSSPTVYVSFEYGLTTAYGSTTPPQAMSATGAFSAPITGLSTSTTYNFRAKVTDGATTVNGSNATFTTTAPVLTVATGSATGITTSTATLTGTLSDMGAYSSVSVSFEYGPTTSYGSATTPQTKTTTGAFSATISGEKASAAARPPTATRLALSPAARAAAVAQDAATGSGAQLISIAQQYRTELWLHWSTAWLPAPVPPPTRLATITSMYQLPAALQSPSP